MEQTPTIGDYVRATSHALTRVFTTHSSRTSHDFKLDAHFPSESKRAWDDTFVMWNSEEDQPTVRAGLYP
jgi:hypothetical protein